jgi:hypothetical protein
VVFSMLQRYSVVWNVLDVMTILALAEVIVLPTYL